MSHDRIPQLIDEQDLALLLDRQTEILDATQRDEAAAIHHSGVSMAAGIENYLRACLGQMADIGTEHGRHGEHLLAMIDHAQQLRAHHLDYLERLTH